METLKPSKPLEEKGSVIFPPDQTQHPSVKTLEHGLYDGLVSGTVGENNGDFSEKDKVFDVVFKESLMKGVSSEPSPFLGKSLPVSDGNAVEIGDSSVLAVSSTVHDNNVILVNEESDASVDKKLATIGNSPFFQVCSTVSANDIIDIDNECVAGVEVADKKLEISGSTISILAEVFGPSDGQFHNDDLEYTGKIPSHNILHVHKSLFDDTGHRSLEAEAQRGKEVEGDTMLVHRSGKIDKFESKSFIGDIKDLAKDVLGHTKIDTSVIKNCLSAFYRTLGHQQLLMEQVRLSNQIGSSVVGEGIVSTIPAPKSKKRKRSKTLSDTSDKAQDIIRDVRSEKGHNSRERRKSKYLQPPYVNLIGSGVPKNVLAVEEEEIEELKEDSSLVDSSGNKSQKKSKKGVNERDLPLNPNILNESSAEMLSQLRVTALDCCYTIKLKVDLVQRYFLRFRKLVYQHISFKEIPEENSVEGIAEQKIRKKSEEKTSTSLKMPRKSEIQEMGNFPNVDQGNNGLPVESSQVKAKKRKRSSKSKSSETVSSLSDIEGSKLKDVPVSASHNVSQNKDPVIGRDLPDSNGNVAAGKTNIKKMSRKKAADAVVLMSDFDYSKLKANGEQRGTALLLKFSAETPLPSKEALVSAFSGFGELIESETHIFNSTFNAQVVFVNNSDGKTAFCSLAKISPFGTALVNYRLLDLSAMSTVLEADSNLREPQLQKLKQKLDQKPKQKLDQRPKQKPKLSPPKSKMIPPVNPSMVPAKPVGPPAVQLNGKVPDMVTMKKKLERMRAMMEQAGDTLPAEMRAKLDSEIKGLLAKVSSSA